MGKGEMRGAVELTTRAAGPTRRSTVGGVLLAALLTVVACGDDPVAPPGTTLFVVEVSGERFRVAVFGADRIAAFEQRLASGEEGVINGPLVPGDGGFNQPWSWHLDAESTAVADLAIELCDGRPSMVEEDLDYWFESVGQYCPWGARVVERIDG